VDVVNPWRADVLLAFVRRWQNWLMALFLIVVVLIGIRLWPRPPLSANAPGSTAVYDDHGRLLRLTLSSDEKYRQWIALDAMPRSLVEGVQLHEDRWFHWHPGFNPVSLARGAFVTYARGGARQGGSTLTMQLARLMYRINTRTPRGKVDQVMRAVWLEMRYSKRDILEAYLNYAPYGRNIEGVGAASLIYFGKPASALTLPEALTLAVIPQDPSRRSRKTAQSVASATTAMAGSTSNGSEQDATLPASAVLLDARNRLYARWRRSHRSDALEDALFKLPLTMRQPQQLPFDAPHFVEQVLNEMRISTSIPPRIDTTLDLPLQRAVERQLQDYIAHTQERGVRNAAALLVDARDMSVKALVGSTDYFDAAIAGQVNGTAAKRSPGSTLKPFIYALGMDQGVLHPRTILRDVPTSFGPFTPENFDGRFLGPVSATDALIRSRNIPAVWVASQLNTPSFYDFLKSAGVSRMASEKHYGLALVLGGGEVTMQELATLYAMLANRGMLRPLRFSGDAPQANGVRLLSDEASFMVLDMLRQNQRPDDTVGGQPMRMPVYWKTGTSWGFRDAWTAGIFGPYVLVVWAGNFDGQGNPSLIGIEAAAPLFFRIVDALQARDPDMREPAWTLPAHIKRVEVCLASGDLPNAWCPQRATTWFIPGKSPIRVSTVHRQVMIDNRTGLAACPPYDPRTTHAEIYEYWPSDLAHVFAQAGMPRRQPPAEPACNAKAGASIDAVGASGMDADGEPPRITSPLRGAAYTLRRGHAQEQRIALSVTLDATARHVFWFVDDAYIGESSPGETTFWQEGAPGTHRVRAVDDQGRSDIRELRVVAEE
jgi:penicillin-binding protein 1C